jgi:hypothetical protein
VSLAVFGAYPPGTLAALSELNLEACVLVNDVIWWPDSRDDSDLHKLLATPTLREFHASCLHVYSQPERFCLPKLRSLALALRPRRQFVAGLLAVNPHFGDMIFRVVRNRLLGLTLFWDLRVTFQVRTPVSEARASGWTAEVKRIAGALKQFTTMGPRVLVAQAYEPYACHLLDDILKL